MEVSPVKIERCFVNQRREKDRKDEFLGETYHLALVGKGQGDPNQEKPNSVRDS